MSITYLTHFCATNILYTDSCPLDIVFTRKLVVRCCTRYGTVFLKMNDIRKISIVRLRFTDFIIIRRTKSI